MRWLLHIKDAGQHGYEHVFLHCRDTDVVSFLVSYYDDLHIPEIWVVAGTQLKRRYIPIQDIHSGLEQNVRSNLLAFHAVTVCELVCKTLETYSVKIVSCAPRTCR